MTVRINADGTTAPVFTIGVGGVTLRQGTTVPDDEVGNDGDVYFRHGPNPMIFQRIDGEWIVIQQEIEFVRTTSPKGLTSIIPSDSDYHAVVAGSNSVTNLTLPTGYNGKQIIIKDETGSANTHNINVVPNAADEMETGTGIKINAAFGTATLIFHGSWRLIRAFGSTTV